MTEIKLTINDIDGVLSNFVKPNHPNQQEIGPYKEDLDKVKEVIKRHEEIGVKHSVCTGRAHYSIQPVVDYIGINAPSVFEHGTYIRITNNEGYRLVEKVFPNLVEPSNILESWIGKLNDGILHEQFPNTRILRRRKENTHILTYEFAGVNGNELYRSLEQLMPEEVKSNISSGSLQAIVSKGVIEGNQGGYIDIMPNVNKDAGVRHVINILGLTREQVLGIEDYYHSGLPMLQETGHVACPANAQDELKSYVKQRGGFVASRSYAQGWLEIMECLFADKLESI